jgi:hypothetical protein
MSSSLVDLIFHYFTFIACGVSLLNLWTIRNKASSAVKIYVASFSALFFVWGLLQFIGGYSTFFFVLLPLNIHPLVAVFWLIYFISLWASAAWVIWGNGANELLQSDFVSGKESLKTPQTLKLFYAVTSVLFPLLVIWGYMSGFFGRAVIELNDLIF